MAEAAPAGSTARPDGDPAALAVEARERRTAWRLAATPLLVGKAISLLVLLATAAGLGQEGQSLWEVARRMFVNWDAARAAFVNWDAIHYLHIAQHGYANQLDFHQAFLPGFPALMAALTPVVRDEVVAGLLINTVAEAVALYYVARLVMAERDVQAAGFAVWCVALGPMAFFLTGIYPDSLLIAGAAAALHHSRRGRHGRAALAATLACAVRLNGLALVPALVYERLRQSRHRPRRDLLLILAAPAPLLAYFIFLRIHTGDALALFHAQALPTFGHSLDWPWSGFWVTWHTVVSSDGEVQAVFIREVGFAFMGLAACVAAWASPRFPRMLALYCSLIWLMATSLTFWRSVPRYDLALFPVVLLLADLSRRWRLLQAGIVVTAGVIMAWGSWIFARGHWLG